MNHTTCTKPYIIPICLPLYSRPLSDDFVFLSPVLQPTLLGKSISSEASSLHPLQDSHDRNITQVNPKTLPQLHAFPARIGFATHCSRTRTSSKTLLLAFIAVPEPATVSAKVRRGLWT